MKIYQASLLTFLSMAANPAAAITCFEGTETAAGSTTVYPIAVQWASSYAKTCPDATITVEQGGSTVGSKRVCGDATLGAVDIGNMSRDWKPSEAAVQPDGYTYNCLIGDTTRSVAQMPVFNDALVLIVKKASGAYECIQKLGCLSKDQLRWMFTNYTESQLTAYGWDSTSIANSDMDDSTHYWSELDYTCAKETIGIAGPDSLSGEYDFFKTTIFNGTSEGFRSSYVPKTNHSDINTYIYASPYYIGLNNFKTALSTPDTTSPVSIKNPDSGDCVPPSATTIGDDAYPLQRLTYMNVYKNNCTTLLWGLDYIEYGYTTEGQADVDTAGGVALTSAQISNGTSRITALRAGCQ